MRRPNKAAAQPKPSSTGQPEQTARTRNAMPNLDRRPRINVQPLHHDQISKRSSANLPENKHLYKDIHKPLPVKSYSSRTGQMIHYRTPKKLLPKLM